MKRLRSLSVCASLALGAGLATLAACSASERDKIANASPSGDAEAPRDAAVTQPTGTFNPNDASVPDASCPDLPPPPTSISLDLAAPYQGIYSVYELGPVPGVSPDMPLGGAVLAAGTTDTLLVGVASESPDGALYSVKIKRDACGHIVDYDGIATRVANAPYVDATLLYGPGDVLMFPMWSGATINKMGQLPAGGTSPVELEMTSVGIGGGGPGSAGFVPPTVPLAAGELRILTQNAMTEDGYWYHVDYRTGGAKGTFVFANGSKKTVLPNWPGGFAYVPAGSPGFDAQALIVAEWNHDSVATYDVDDHGDPVVATRKPFFNAFPRPWGAYFEPVTGDYLFLTWRAVQNGNTVGDRIVVVAGFKPPPPPPAVPPPK